MKVSALARRVRLPARATRCYSAFVGFSCALRARLVAAVLSLGLIYAFTCSATCANCIGLGATAATESHACGHPAVGAAGGAKQRHPTKPDCFGHHRFDFDVMQSDGLSRVQLSATGSATGLFCGGVRAQVVNIGASFFSDLAPPRSAMISPQRNISILRI